MLSSDSMSDSGKIRENLLKQARIARESAYCKYSSFAVGAALLTESGEIYTGCNIENASYSLCICAERIAFGKAVSEGHRKFRAIAIVGGSEDSETDCPPCGACRQFMAEFCNADFEIYLAEKKYLLRELLPNAFIL